MITTQARRQRPPAGRRPANKKAKGQRPTKTKERPVKLIRVPMPHELGNLTDRSMIERVLRLEQTMAELGRAAAEHIEKDADDAEGQSNL